MAKNRAETVPSSEVYISEPMEEVKRTEPAAGVVTETPKAAEPAAKKKDTGDPELKAMGRVIRLLGGLDQDARERVGAYLANRFKPRRE